MLVRACDVTSAYVVYCCRCAADFDYYLGPLRDIEQKLRVEREKLDGAVQWRPDFKVSRSASRSVARRQLAPTPILSVTMSVLFDHTVSLNCCYRSSLINFRCCG